MRELAFFKDYLFRNRWWLLLSGVLLLCVYSAWIVSPELHIDLDTYITYQGTRSGGGHVGRQGFTLVNILLGMENFNPYFASMAGWLFLWLAGVAMGYVLYRFGLKSPVFCAAIGLFVFISPVHEDHFYWYQRLVSLAIGYMLCAASAGLSYYGIFKKKRIPCLLAVLGMIWAFSIYQSFALVYVVLAIAAYLLLFRRWILVEGKENVPFFSAAVKQFLLFVLAYGINTVITYTISFSAAEFTSSVINWGKMPVAQNIQIILHTVRIIFLGGPFYMTGMYGILALCAVIGAVVECWQCREKVKASYRLLYIAALAAMQFVPCLMAVYVGAEPLTHGQMSYPVVMAGNLVFLNGLADRLSGKNAKTIMKTVVAAIAVVLLWNQSQVTMRQVYTDHVSVEEDKNTILELTERIHEVSSAKKPVAFIGTHINNLNPACLWKETEYIGISVVSWNHSTVSHYLSESARTVNFMKTLGIDMESIGDEQTMTRARIAALDMPAWPVAGSVVDAGDYVIVKLGEDEWPEEIIEPSVDEVQLTDDLPEENIQAPAVSVTVKSTEIKDGTLTIKGVVDQANDDYTLWEPQVYLADVSSGACYALNTVKSGNHWNTLGGKRCPNSQFTAMAPWDGVFDQAGEYVLLFKYTDTKTGQASLLVPLMPADNNLGLVSSDLLDGTGGKKIIPPVAYGFRCQNAAISSSLELISTGASGYVLHGPYSQSVAGTYDITLHYEVEKAPDGAEGVFDVALDAEQIAAAPITAENESVTIEDVAIDGGHRFEVRVYVPDSMVVRVRSIEYERVN